LGLLRNAGSKLVNLSSLAFTTMELKLP